MAQFLTQEQLQADALVKTLLAGGPGGTAQAGVPPTGSGGPPVPSFDLPQAPPPVSVEEPPSFLDKVLRSLSPFLSAASPEERTKVLNTVLQLQSKEDREAQKEERERRRQERFGTPTPSVGQRLMGPLEDVAGALGGLAPSLEQFAGGQQPRLATGPPAQTMPSGEDVRGLGTSVMSALDRFASSTGNIPPGAFPRPQIDPAAITADLGATLGPGAAVPEFEGKRSQPPGAKVLEAPLPIPGSPAPSPGQIPSGGALNDIERLLGSEAFSGQLQPPDFTRAGEALQRSAPTSPQGLSTVEKLLNVVGGAAAGARGGGNLAETILGAGGGAARGAAASRAEDTRRQERFEDLSSRFAQAETNFELARVQAQQDTSKTNLDLAQRRADTQLRLLLEQFKLEQPKVIPLGQGRYIIQQRDFRTGEVDITEGNTNDPSDKIRLATEEWKLIKAQLDAQVAAKKLGQKRVYIGGKFVLIDEGGAIDTARFALRTREDVRVQMEGRALHRILLLNHRLVRKDLGKLPNQVKGGTDLYTAEELQIMKEAFSNLSLSGLETDKLEQFTTEAAIGSAELILKLLGEEKK